MVEMHVEGLSLDPQTRKPIVILRQNDGKGLLPLWIGAMEAMTISLVLNGEELPRPLAHDLLLMVAKALNGTLTGVDIVDCATASLSSLTSQPSLNAVVAALEGQERDTGLDLQRLQKLDDYWADVRLRYESFDHGLKTNTTDIYRYEIPGGQYTNLRPQVESLGLGDRFEEVKEMYKTVNDMLGDPVKVTPSSKVVGDLAIFMVQNDLTPENIVRRGEALAFPDSVVSYFKV